VRYGNHRVGRLREDPNTILMSVRAFYADIAHWALEDPGRWAPFAAPNPITGRDLLGQNKQHRRARARMHERIRELAPSSPHSSRRRNASVAARPRSSRSQPRPNRGSSSRLGVSASSSLHGAPPRPDFVDPELSARSSPRPGSSATSVLPSRTPFSPGRSSRSSGTPASGWRSSSSSPTGASPPTRCPELAEVLAAIISRVRSGDEHLPLVTRYDGSERVHSRPMPFLFQRVWGLSNRAMTHGAAGELIDRTALVAGLTGPSGLPVTFTPHDLRRIFATDAVASGLPVHIAAKLLGHETLATTQAYVAVYDPEVIEHHQAFIARRRRLRPSEEYREPTETEWDEFLGHFERRKVELGLCGRAYGTSCEHEHACIRCPMLRSDPAQLPRLLEIIANLRSRLDEAHERGWLGEVDGLEATVTAAEFKLEAMRRAAGRDPVPIELRSSVPGQSSGGAESPRSSAS
jgi:hypothetical protein